MIWRTQKQKLGDNGIGAQAGRDVVIQGMSYADTKAVARDVAMEVFRENATRLVREAHATAHARAEEFVDNFLDQMAAKHPDALHHMQEPGVQSALLEAQSTYARTGDADLGELLVELLIDRVGKTERDLAQLALISAIEVARELRSAHLALLASNLFVKGIRLNVTSVEELAQGMEEALYPLQDALHTINSMDLDYLVGRGCLILSAGQISIAEYLRMTYPGMFTRGFNTKQWPGGAHLLDTPLVEAHPDHPGNHRIAAITNEDLDMLLESYELAYCEHDARTALRQNPVGDQEIERLLTSAAPRLTNTFSRWKALNLSHYVNTATGVAIGHAYLRRRNEGAVPPLERFL